VCVALPGQVVAIDPGSTAATVAYGAVERHVDLMMTPEVGVGDWVIVHSGFALRRIGSAEAADIRSILDDPVAACGR